MGAGQPPVGATEGKKEIRGSYLGSVAGSICWCCTPQAGCGMLLTGPGAQLTGLAAAARSQ